MKLLDFSKLIWRWVTQLVCPHSWGPVQTYQHKGYGVAEITCAKCGERHTYEFWYKDESDNDSG